MHNYTLQDLKGYGLALLVFPLFLLLPGYVVAWWANLLDFRRRSFTERTATSLAVSVALCGVFTTLIGRFFSLAVALRVFEGCGLVFLVLLLWEAYKRGLPARTRPTSSTAMLFAMMVGWAIVVIAVLVDLQFGHRLYLSVATYDLGVRASLVRAAVRTGVPPANPFFYPGAFVPLRYYYFWSVVAALPTLLAGVDARLSFYASSAWCGFALMAIIPLYLKYFFQDSERLRRKSVIGIALLAVTGLDLLPTIYLAAFPPRLIYGDMEWWDIDQITSWANSLLWVPHHIAAVVACLFGFLLLWHASHRDESQCRPGDRAKAVAMAAIAFASAGGYSVYVTFTFAIFLAIWTAIVLAQRQFKEFTLLFVAGALTLALSLPYLRELRAPGGGAGFVTFGFHEFPGGDLLLEKAGIPAGWLAALIQVVLVAFGYFLELGFFFAVAVIQWRRDWPFTGLSQQKKALWTMFFVSLGINAFVRSQTIGTNDLGFRSALFLQFVTLLWAVPMVESNFRGPTLALPSATPHRRSLFASPYFLKALLVIGVLGSVYQLAMLRSFFPLAETGKLHFLPYWLPKPGSIGETTYELREAYESLNTALPRDAVLQPNIQEQFYLPRMLYSDRQGGALGYYCGAEFGGSPDKCLAMVRGFMGIFNRPQEEDLASLDKTCAMFSVDDVIVGPEDKVWHNPQSWVWTRTPVYSSDLLRILPCGRRYQGVTGR